MVCARNGDIDGVRRRLKDGDDVNARDVNTGWTALHHAAHHGSLGIAKELLLRNANTTLETNDGKSAKELAFEHGHREMINMITNPPNPDRTDIPDISELASDVPDRIKLSRWEVDVRLWNTSTTQGRSAVKSSSVDLFGFIYHDGISHLDARYSSLVTESQLRWFHLPVNNLTWAKHLITRLCIMDNKPLGTHNRIIDFMNRSLFEIGEGSKISKLREPACYMQTDSDQFVSIVLPYLNHESFGARKAILNLSKANSEYIPLNISRSYKERADKLARVVNHYDRSIYLPRSLDESYYLGMTETDMQLRDDDQVVSKDWSKRNEKHPHQSEEDFKSSKPIVMVHQMWLWVLDERTVVTAFTERIQPGKSTLFTALSSALQEMKQTPLPQRSNSSWPAKFLARELVSQCVNFLDRPNLAGFKDPVFSSFDNEIGGVSERVTKKYTEFRESLGSDHDDPSDPETVINIHGESELLLDIRDVRDELSMVRNVFCQQRDVLEDMETEFSHGSSVKSNDHQALFNGPSCNPRVPKFLRRLQLIDENAENVERAVQHLLDLKQKQANLNEASSTAQQTTFLARQAESSARQGKVILAFTVVTVLFTPLSWIGAILTINLEQGDTYKTWQVVFGEVAALIFTAMVIGISLWFAPSHGKGPKKNKKETTKEK